MQKEIGTVHFEIRGHYLPRRTTTPEQSHCKGLHKAKKYHRMKVRDAEGVEEEDIDYRLRYDPRARRDKDEGDQGSAWSYVLRMSRVIEEQLQQLNIDYLELTAEASVICDGTGDSLFPSTNCPLISSFVQRRPAPVSDGTGRSLVTIHEPPVAVSHQTNDCLWLTRISPMSSSRALVFT
ncbi:hypothetical protein HAX54_023030 [Datura stramonium]|uniref:Uncharacterized protein n=1 Tax=Datura stramonium TaxID=4076 RepID=A0ABS8UVM8_DATST|nr:hypothetical protein [Datura stramonium]